MSSQSPSVTVMNGQSGSFSDATITPFVVGVVPVVGSLSPMMAFGSGAGGATAVQLPTFGTFGTSTSVSVPDQGSTSLGGVDSAADGQNQAGLPGLRNSAIGSSRSAANTQVHAAVHDFQKADAALLGAGAGMANAPREDPTAQSLAEARSSTAGQAAQAWPRRGGSMRRNRMSKMQTPGNGSSAGERRSRMPNPRPRESTIKWRRGMPRAS